MKIFILWFLIKKIINIYYLKREFIFTTKISYTNI